jgi:transposase InsO family protein
MTDETREQVALFRYKLISPVLAEPARVQNEYFRDQAQRKHQVPGHKQVRKYGVSTFKNWLRLYRRDGFEALKPKVRADRGRPRRLGEEAWATVQMKCKAFPHWTVQKLYEHLAAEGLLGQPPISYNTLARLVRTEGLLAKRGRTDARKRYEVSQVNDLWVCDFMHGPPVQLGGRSQKAILCAIIDDHSRMIVGHAFNVHETVSALTMVLKDALLAYGLPLRLYVDNGAAFCAELLTKACAQAKISLIHSKPYDPPSRGKIERFFRTVNERFLSGLGPSVTLDELNEAFALWLAEDYHHRHHAGIDQMPIERYNASAAKVDIRRLSAAELDEIFLVRHERIVNNDATISFKGRIYEVPTAYIRQRIELRHPVDDNAELYLYDQGCRIARLKLVDVKENARTFRPSSRQQTLSFSKKQVA